jgi:hypothetical protein
LKIVIFLADETQVIRQLAENYPLNTEDIKLLFDHSDQYIIPYLQTETKRCGLVLYNTEGRDGAMEEASNMEDGLVHAGIQTQKIEWKSADELPNVIIAQLRELIPQGLSLLVVSIMSHGCAGILSGSNNSTVPIYYLLSILEGIATAHVPMVSSK